MSNSLVQGTVVMAAIAALSLFAGSQPPLGSETTVVSSGLFAAPSVAAPMAAVADPAAAGVPPVTETIIEVSQATLESGDAPAAAGFRVALSPTSTAAAALTTTEAESAATRAPTTTTLLPAPTAEPVTAVPAATAVPTATALPAATAVPPTPAPAATAAPATTAPPTATSVPAVAPTATVAPAPTSAPAPPALPSYQRRGEAALARVPVSPSSLGFGISFHPPRAGYGGLTYPDRRHIEIYVSPDWSDGHLAHVVAHEIGHAVDMVRNSRADHERWRAARGINPSTKWWADPYTADFASPGGDFAECFAAWAVGTSSGRSHFGSCAGTGALVSELVWS